jgi:hypothetical protein
MFKRIVVLFIIVFAMNGCTRDDICPEGAAITPNLVITFNDFNNQNKRKKVIKLTIETDYEESVTIFANRETDSIAIPLNVNSEITKYRFIRTTTIENEDPVVNVDRITFVYNREDKYVNRACGYRTEYSDFDTVLEDEGSDNWIKDFKIKRDKIVDEKQAHLTILH